MTEDQRDPFVAYVRSHAVGPYDGPQEVLEELPYRRYLMGTLYPRGLAVETVSSDETDDDGAGSVGRDLADDPVTLANEWLPSSIGLSLFFDGSPSILVHCWGARYDVERSNRFVRVPLAEPEAPELVALSKPDEKATSLVPVLDGRAEIRCLWRRLGDGWLVTVTLVNAEEQDLSAGKPDQSLCLHQVGFTVEPTEARLLEYPTVDAVLREDEDDELALLYRKRKTYAIGHGCCAAWDQDPKDGPRVVRAELLPTFELPALDPNVDTDPLVLSLDFLSDQSRPRVDLVQRLEAFVESYENWIRDLPASHSDIPPNLHDARGRLIAE